MSDSWLEDAWAKLREPKNLDVDRLRASEFHNKRSATLQLVCQSMVDQAEVGDLDPVAAAWEISRIVGSFVEECDQDPHNIVDDGMTFDGTMQILQMGEKCIDRVLQAVEGTLPGETGDILVKVNLRYTGRVAAEMLLRYGRDSIRWLSGVGVLEVDETTAELLQETDCSVTTLGKAPVVEGDPIGMNERVVDLLASGTDEKEVLAHAEECGKKAAEWLGNRGL